MLEPFSICQNPLCGEASISFPEPDGFAAFANYIIDFTVNISQWKHF